MKTGWILGAAFLSLAIVIVALLASMDTATVERLSARETLDGIEVPVIGTVGDFPDPAHRTVVNVTADGRIVVEGREYSMAALAEELKRVGDSDRGFLIPGTSRYLSAAIVVLRLDGSLPWRLAQRPVEACAAAGIWRLCFAVRCGSEGPDGGLSFELPRDKGCEDPADLAWKEIEVAPGIGGSPAALAAALSQSPASLTGKLGVTLSIDPRLPTRVALATIDAAIGAGAIAVRLRLWPAVTDRYAGFAAEIASLRTPGQTYSLRLDGQPIDDAHSAPSMSAGSRLNRPVLIPSFGVLMNREPTVEPVTEPPTRPVETIPK